MTAIAPGERMGRYRVLELLGVGGMGMVLSAYDADLDRRVALKLLRGAHDEAHATRLRAEARALARLSHPNVIAVHEIGSWRGRDFVAMEFVDGATAAEWVAAEPRTWMQILDVYRAAGAGLAAAHRARLVHRDVKPSNILVGRDGRVRVSDFGLARPEGTTNASPAPIAELAFRAEAGMTLTGAIVGTPAYMSPEQCRGERVDARSDQFSFCVALYEALYGARPFPATTLDELVDSIERAAPAAGDRGRDVPTWVRRALVRGLAAEPGARHASMDELLDALQPPRARWRVPAAIAAGVVVVGGLAAAIAARDAPARAPVCPDARVRLAGVWDADVRLAAGRVLAPMRGGPDAFERAAAVLDRYADAWVGARLDACEATHVRHEQSEARLDARMTCLDRSRAALGALARRMTDTPDDQVAGRVVEAALRLPVLDDCADPKLLDSATPLPADPVRRARVEAVLTRLADARAMTQIGAAARGLELAAEVAAEAEASGHAPAHAEALAVLGNVRDDLGDGAGARAAFVDAIRIASEAGADDAAALASLGLLWTTAFTLHQLDAAVAMTPLVDAAVERSGRAARRASLATAVGSVAWFRGDLATARTQFERGIALAEREFGADHVELVGYLINHGAVLDDLDDLAGAEAQYARALLIYQRLLGERNPRLATLHCHIGDLRDVRGQYAAARGSYEACRDLRRDGFGPDHAETLLAEHRLADVMTELGELDAAERRYRELLAHRGRALGADHPHVPTTQGTLALVLLRRGKPGEARGLADASLAGQRRAWGADSQHVASALDVIVQLELAAGRLDAAEAALQEALRIRTATFGADNRKTLATVAARCDIAVRSGRARELLPDCERAARGLASIGVAPAAIAEARWALARALDATAATETDRARVRELVTQALVGARAAEGDHAELIREIEAWPPRR